MYSLREQNCFDLPRNSTPEYADAAIHRVSCSH